MQTSRPNITSRWQKSEDSSGGRMERSCRSTFSGSFAHGQPQAATDTDAVGVADHAAGHAVNVAQQQIGGLAAHAGEPQQFLHGAGDLSAVVGQEHLAGQHDVPGLVLIKSAGADQLLHPLDGGAGHGLQSGELCEQGRCHLIDPCVGTLGGQPHGDHQLVIFFVVQGALALRVALLQKVDDGLNFFLHNALPFCVFLHYTTPPGKRKAPPHKRAGACVA